MTRAFLCLLTPTLGLIAACSSIEASTSSELAICDIVQCDSATLNAPALSVDGTVTQCKCEGPAPALPDQICVDGTVAGPACVESQGGACEWIVTECPDPQPQDCSASDCAAGHHCEVDCHPCDAPDPKTPCDSFACQSTCVPD